MIDVVGTSHLGENGQIAERPESEFEPSVVIDWGVIIIHGGVLHQNAKLYITHI